MQWLLFVFETSPPDVAHRLVLASLAHCLSSPFGHVEEPHLVGHVLSAAAHLLLDGRGRASVFVGIFDIHLFIVVGPDLLRAGLSLSDFL